MTRTLVVSVAASLALAGCFTTPSDGPEPVLTPDAPTTTDDLVVQLVDGPIGEGVAISWYVDDAPVQSLQNLDTVPAGITAKGQTWRVVLSPIAFVGGGGDVAPAGEASVTIGNTAPTATVSIAPEAPDTETDLVAEPLGDDIDGDALTYSYLWLRDGAVVDGETGPTLSADLTEHGERWTVQVTAHDGEADSEVAEASVDIENLPPVADGVQITPDAPRTADTLTATPTGADPDGDPLTWTFTWYVDGVAVPDVSEDALSPELFAKGEQVEVEAVPNDGFVDGEPVRSAAVVIGNTPPDATGAHIEPTDPTEISTLTCVGEGFTDVDGDAEGWVVTWTVNAIEVATQPALSGDWFDRGDNVGCSLRPFDGDDVGPQYTARPVLIQNTPPVLDGVSIDNTAPREGDTLTAVLGSASDVDGDPIRYRYRWTVDGSTAGSGPTLSSAGFDRDQVVVVEVTPTDGTDDGATVRSASVTVLNTAPAIDTLTLSPSSPKTSEDVRVTVSASDADGDAISYTYAWYVNGSLVGETSGTLPSSAFDKGDTVYVIVTPTDGTDTGAPARSATITAVNSAPSITGVSLSPSTIREGSVVSCVPAGFVDDDGDSPVYRYRWLVNGSVVSTAATLDGADFDKGDTVQCEVTPTDGTDAGTALTSATVTVSNTAPVVTTVTLSDLSPATNDTVTATVTGVSDADGDSVSLTYDWKVNGTSVRRVSKASRSDSLTGADFDKKDTIVVDVTPTDGTDSGATVRSATATAVNTPPTLSIAISPSPARTRDTLTAVPTASDIDGDSISYLYRWEVNGSVEGTASTLSGALFDKGDDIDLQVTALDGDSSVVRATSLTIANTAPTAPSVSLSPAPDAEMTDPLTCTATGSADSDGDSITYRYTWLRNGSTYSTPTSTSAVTIPSSVTSPGERWQCRAVAFDGTDTSASTSSAVATIRNLDSCKSYYDAGYRGNGSYTIYVDSATHVVECDMTTAGGGWTVLVDLPGGIPTTSAFRAEWDNNPINNMGRYQIVSTRTLRWAGGGSNVFDFNDEIFWPNGGEIYADINTYMYSHEDSSIFFWVEDDSGNDLNVLCRDGTTLGGSWPSAWSTGERVYMPGYTCPSRTGTGSEYSFRYHGVVRSSFSRTLDAFHFTSFQSDNGTGGDWSYLYDLRVMVR